MKRFLSFVLASLMFLSLLPVSAIADGEETQPQDTVTQETAVEEQPPEGSGETEGGSSETAGTAGADTSETGNDSVSDGLATSNSDQSSETGEEGDGASDVVVSEGTIEADMGTGPEQPDDPNKPSNLQEDSTEPSDENSGDEQLPEEGQPESLEPENESSDAALMDESPVEEKQPEPLTLSVAKLKDVQIKNGAAEFVVKVSCNQEDALITYQWQQLDTKGAFNEIEDKNERALAREEAWEDMKKETKAKLSFKGIEEYSEFENLLFRCRVTAGDVVVYSDEVKLLPEIVPEEQEETIEPDPAVDEPSEDGPDGSDPAAEEPGEVEPAVDKPTETESIEETSDESGAPTEEPTDEDESREPGEEDPATEDEPQEPGDETESVTEGEPQEEEEVSEFVLTEEYVWEDYLTVEEGAIVRVSGAVTVPEEVTLTVAGTLIIEEDASLTVAGKLILTETVTVEGDALAITTAEIGEIEGLARFLPEEEEPLEIVLTEDYVWEGDLIVEEGMTVRVSGAAAVPEGVALTVAGALVMDEEATLTVAGRLILTETAAVEGDVLAITAAETGEIKGLERFLPEEEITWEDILSAGIFGSEKPVALVEDVTIPAESILVIQGGELIIAPEAALTVEGLLIIDGGTLTVSEGATLKNDMFIQVEGSGVLKAEGAYQQAEAAAIVWDATEEDSNVEGVDRSMIDKTVFAADAEALSAALSRDGYRTLTVLVPSSELVKELDRIPNGVIISVR